VPGKGCPSTKYNFFPKLCNSDPGNLRFLTQRKEFIYLNNNMTMSPALSKLTLTSHITFSVGWLGAVAGFLALAIAGLTGQDSQVVRSAYVAMELVGWFVIVPFCLSAFLTGIIQSLGTHWGLLKHYWVLVKLLLTVAATTLLFLHMKPVSYVALVASEKVLTSTELSGLRIQLLADAGVALFVLLVTTAISVYKPWGRIQFSVSSNQGTSNTLTIKAKTSWGFYAILTLILLFLLIVILHLAGISLGGHH
jgi:hypothetical protein